MDRSLAEQLAKALARIDRPGTFCVQGSVPAILPGLEVQTLGQIALPLGAAQARQLKEVCEQAPYGKGTETLVDTSVRRVWRLTPDRFTLANPAWGSLLEGILGQVQKQLGLDSQRLAAHLYDLLLYEPGSFFLPHKDGEKLDRMVATLVIALPSPHEGGELVVRHEGREEIVNVGADPFQIHYVAFYADCEHEVRPLRGGHRLCLVYNITLARGKNGLQAPRSGAHIEKVTELLRQWAASRSARRLAITLNHEYTEKGLAWDTLKGQDHALGDILAEAAGRAGCQAYLALVTFWESGSAEGDYDYDYRRRRSSRYRDEEDDAGEYEMGEVFDSSLIASHGLSRSGAKMPLEQLRLVEEDFLDPETLRGVKPEEHFEGYTGNAGMTLDRWYRHAAIILWPNHCFYDVLCDEDPRAAVDELQRMVGRWRKVPKTSRDNLRGECVRLAAAIVSAWRVRSYATAPEPDKLLALLHTLDEAALIEKYIGALLERDLTLEPGRALVDVCRKHGWQTFEPQLVTLFKNPAGLRRNLRLLVTIALARPKRDDGWAWLCETLTQALLSTLERIDRGDKELDWRTTHIDRDDLLPGLVRALVASGQSDALARLVVQMRTHPDKYPLIKVQLAALTKLADWLKKNAPHDVPSLSDWLTDCRKQLETLTQVMPTPPADLRRANDLSCRCELCRGLQRFLADPVESVHRIRAAQDRRDHVEGQIRAHLLDVRCTTEKKGSPYTLVCTKTTASYEAALKKYHEDLKHLALVRDIEAAVTNDASEQPPPSSRKRTTR